jgi:hypothetical protein
VYVGGGGGLLQLLKQGAGNSMHGPEGGTGDVQVVMLQPARLPWVISLLGTSICLGSLSAILG